MLGVSLLMTLVVHLFRTTVNATSTEVSYAMCAMMIILQYIDMHTMCIVHVEYWHTCSRKFCSHKFESPPKPLEKLFVILNFMPVHYTSSDSHPLSASQCYNMHQLMHAQRSKIFVPLIFTEAVLSTKLIHETFHRITFLTIILRFVYCRMFMCMQGSRSQKGS